MALIGNAEAAQLSNFVHKFVSCIDGKEDNYVLLPGKNDTLIVYLHSLNGDYSEPFKSDGESSLATALIKEFPGASFLSLDYGTNPSWGSPVARIDISNNLGSTIKVLKIKRIILIGISMGGSTALTYVATAPSYIKDRITGIVAVSPCANLTDLYKQTAQPEIKSSLESAFGGDPNNKNITKNYEQSSFDTCLAFLPAKIKVGIISATEDKAVPINLQKDVVRDLSNRDISVKLYEVEGKFESLPIKTILEASHFVAQKSY